MLYRNHPQCIPRSLGVAGIWLIGAFMFKDHVPVANRPLDPDFTKHTATLLQNIYRAYDYGDQSDVYDALAHSVNGPLLDELFLKIQSGLRMQEQGGAIANVQEVRIVSIKPALDNPESLDCKWNVTGTVEHWGHIHTRENQYSARIKLDVSEKGRGRISKFEVTNEKRVRFETGLRMFDDG